MGWPEHLTTLLKKIHVFFSPMGTEEIKGSFGSLVKIDKDNIKVR